MATSDWGDLSGGLTTDVRTGVTAGTTPPTGGSSYVFGMRIVENVQGAVGKYCLQTNYSPTAKGGRISGAVRRAALGSPIGFAPFLYFCAQGTTIDAVGYLLGMSDEAASHIELRKGAISQGLPAVAVVAPAAGPNILMRSTDTFAPDTWQHLRLDVIVQGTHDVILQVRRNDLAAHGLGSPVWVTVPGMEGAFAPAFYGFVDDALGVNTGSTPLEGGIAGFAARFETANRAVYYDGLSVDRQL